MALVHKKMDLLKDLRTDKHDFNKLIEIAIVKVSPESWLDSMLIIYSLAN